MIARTILLAGLVALAGACSFSGGAHDDDTSGDDTTGDDSTGDDSTGDDSSGDDAPPPPDAEPADTDGDGVADPADNCALVANPGQANEDADDRGDACDRCPHVGGTDTAGSDADTDGDAIGDQCDPRAGIDRLVVFRGFNDAGDKAGFVVNFGGETWDIIDGQLRQTSPNSGSHELLWRTESLGDVVVTSAIHVEEVNPATGIRIASVIGAYTEAAQDDFYACGLRGANAEAAATLAALHYLSPPTTDQWDEVAFGGTMSAGLAATVQLTATDGVGSSLLRCRADATVNDLDVVGFTPEGYPGLRTLGVRASYDYFFVVEIGE